MKECKLCKNKYEESYFQKSGYCEDNNINLLRISLLGIEKYRKYFKYKPTLIFNMLIPS